MNALTYALFYVTPYISALLFFAGLVHRVYKWLSAPRGAPSPIYPYASRSALGKAFNYMLKIVTFKPLFGADRRLWLASWVFHAGLLLLLFGHFRLLVKFTFLWNLLGITTKEEIARFALISGGLAGLMFLLPQFYLLTRRFTPLLRRLSVFEDYFALLLTLMLTLTGVYMRFFEHIDVEAYRAYFLSLLAFSPSPPSHVSTVFMIHYALAQFMLAYFPWGKLFHSVGAFVTHAVLMVDIKGGSRERAKGTNS